MKTRSLPLRRLVVSVFSALVLAAAAFAGDVDLNAPMPVDPNVKIGTLPNGLTYWLRAHKTPPGKVSAWLHFGSGSLNEEENQRGLAHFLEHLAFNGSENFPPGTLIKYFESIGLRFGRDQNAFTGFDQTTYLLSLPDTKPETVGKGLQYLADIAFRLSLLPEEIDKERKVVLEEVRARKGVGQRITEKQLPLLAPGSRFAERLPIGKEEVLNAANRELIAGYYSKWYRPDNTTLMLVGDLDTAEAEKLIAEAFKDWKAAGPKPTNAEAGIKPYTAPRAAVLSDPELTDASVSVYNIGPLTERQSIADFRSDLVDSVGSWIVNQRLDALVKKGSAPYNSAGVGIFPLMNVVKGAVGQASGKPEKWQPIVEQLLSEIKRAREHGFLEQELMNARAATLAGAEQAARTEVTRDARAFLGRLNAELSQLRKPLADSQRLELLKALLPGVTLQEVNAAFNRSFAAQTRLVLLCLPEKPDLKLPTADELTQLAAKVEGAKVDAPVAEARPKSLMEQEPRAGHVAEQKEEKDLKILSVTLNNGVRLHLRSMDFKKDQVTAQISIAGGEIRETAANRGITDVAALAFAQTATHKLSSTVIRELLIGKNVSVRGGAGNDTLTLTVSGAPKDLEEGFRLAHLLLTQGKVEDSALKVWKEQMQERLEQLRTSVEEQAGEKMRVLLMNDDPRGRQLTKEQIAGLTCDLGQKWLEDTLKHGPIEACIVGDIDRDAALALAAKYLGSLPARERKDAALKKLRKLELKKGPLDDTVEVDTITSDRAVVQCGWRGPDWKDVKERRVMQLAAQIMNSRLHEEIRIKRGLTYSIDCFVSPGRAYEGTGLVGIWFTAAPEKAAEASKIAMDMVTKFAEDGPTDAEMETVRKQVQNQLETTLKEPSFWVGVLAELEYRGTKLSDVKELMEKMTSYTREDILKAARKYIRDENRIQVIATPKKKEGEKGRAGEGEKAK